MKIAIACDHAGFEIKNEIISFLQKKDIDFVDFGTDGLDSVDYPDFAFKAAKAVSLGECEKGILICGTGQGIGISANKVKGIRCAILSDVFSAKMTVMHNNANMIALGSRVIGIGLALEIVETFLNSDFEGGRHQRRIEKIMGIEKGE